MRVFACRQPHVETATVNVQINPACRPALRSDDPHRHPPSADFGNRLQSRRAERGRRDGAFGPRLLQRPHLLQNVIRISGVRSAAQIVGELTP